MNIVVAIEGMRGASLAGDLEREGVTVSALLDPSVLVRAASGAAGADDEVAAFLARSDAVVLDASRDALTAAAVSLCDRCGVRIVPLCADLADERRAASFGLGPPVSIDVDARALVAALSSPPRLLRDDVSPAPRVIAVWGPAGAPGRSTLAIELAVELVRGGRRVGLVDADTHAPSLASALGLADEGPGFASACRSA